MVLGEVLSQSDIEQFIELGYVKLKEAYRPEDALAVQRAIWERIEQRGILEADPATWTEARVHLRESYSGPVFERCNSPRLLTAMQDLVGKGRLLLRTPSLWGWWPVNFSLGADTPWTVPHQGWHWDGHHFRHFVDSPDQGLLALCVFSSIHAQGGGTLLAEGSHAVVARLLARHPDGVNLVDAIAELNRSEQWFHELTTAPASPVAEAARIQRFMATTVRDDSGRSLRVVELKGEPGDVYFCHPFLYHAASQNHSGIPRFLCNRIGTLNDRMRIYQNGPSLSPVEVSIRRALA